MTTHVSTSLQNSESKQPMCQIHTNLQNQTIWHHADQLLWEWFDWSRRWQPRLGAPRVSPYCRQSRTSRQYDEYASYDDVFKGEMEAVEKCVEQLSLNHRQAIVTEMRKRETQQGSDIVMFSNAYSVSLNAILPLLAKEELLHLHS